MDLIGGYNSSGDDSSQDGGPAVATSTNAKAKQATKSPAKGNSAKVSKKGKKILSLTSVLPKHIMERLTRSQARGGAYDTDSDSDSEDGVKSAPVSGNNKANTNKSNTKSNNKGKQTKSNNKSNNKGKSGDMHDQDAGLNSFLQELSSAAKSDGKKDDKSAANNAPTVLGAAFVTSTTETIVRSAKSAVVDIHGGSSSTKSTAKAKASGVKVSTVGSDDGSDGDSDSSSDSDSDSDSDSSSDSDDGAKDKVTPMFSKSSAGARAPAPRPSSVKSGASKSSRSISVKAAPRSRSSVPTPRSMPAPPPPAPSIRPSHQHSHAQAAQGRKMNSKKARKRQMEAMLRQGNVSGIQSDINLQGHDSSHYHLPTEDEQQQQYNAHGIQNVDVSMYRDQQEGKHSNTNQLTHLMANAVALETTRLQNPKKDTSKINRASAKRKYGW